MKLIGYKKCSTCRRAEKALKEKGISFEFQDVQENPPSLQEIKDWVRSSGLPIMRWINTSGQVYRNLNLKEKKDQMTLEEWCDLFGKEPMLLKRPILIHTKATVGREVFTIIEQFDSNH